jgi:hypothetical protein
MQSANGYQPVLSTLAVADYSYTPGLFSPVGVSEMLL